VLGVAYKRDVDDVRESPALDVIQLLEDKGATVSYYDPYVASIRLEQNRVMTNGELTEDWLQAADCVVIVTDHSSFDWSWIIANTRLIVDTRNVTANFKHNGSRVIKL